MSLLDTLIKEADTALRTLLPPQERIPNRPSPAQEVKDIALSTKEKQHIAGLMRVNHSGEVCAQALYQGQALTAKLENIKEQMRQAAIEENDHLAWCEKRLHELGSHPSFLNPLWYAGSLMIGALAGLISDKVSLGFVAETENQVSAHLQGHLARLPQNDLKSRAIIERMQEDEAHHAQTALEAGAYELPFAVRQLMTLVSKVMTKSSYYL